MEPMKPMEPMQPMEPMEPMEPMQPMAPPEQWWPESLGSPSASGGQNEMRYAFFPQDYILLVQTAGRITAYDSGNHEISCVAQQKNNAENLTFKSQNGEFNLTELQQVDLPV